MRLGQTAIKILKAINAAETMTAQDALNYVRPKIGRPRPPFGSFPTSKGWGNSYFASSKRWNGSECSLVLKGLVKRLFLTPNKGYTYCLTDLGREMLAKAGTSTVSSVETTRLAGQTYQRFPVTGSWWKCLAEKENSSNEACHIVFYGCRRIDCFVSVQSNDELMVEQHSASDVQIPFALIDLLRKNFKK